MSVADMLLLIQQEKKKSPSFFPANETLATAVTFSSNTSAGGRWRGGVKHTFKSLHPPPPSLSLAGVTGKIKRTTEEEGRGHGDADGLFVARLGSEIKAAYMSVRCLPGEGRDHTNPDATLLQTGI